MKVLLSGSHLNYYTLRFHVQPDKLDFGLALSKIEAEQMTNVL